MATIASAAASSASKLKYQSITFPGGKNQILMEGANYCLQLVVLVNILGMNVYFVLAEEKNYDEHFFLFIDVAAKFSEYSVLYQAYELTSRRIHEITSTHIMDFVRSIKRSKKLDSITLPDYIYKMNTFNSSQNTYSMSKRNNNYICYFPSFTNTDNKPLQQDLDVYFLFSCC